MSTPAFAVVGRVNKGKSSIVSTLAEDDSVRIEPEPGTTVEVRAYPVMVDGEVLFTLLDTPGFQRAGEVLAWLEARQPSAADRPAAVRAFVDAHAGDPRFGDECRLLAPILDGAGILYVVDGAHPYRPNYEEEMEILRWTGRPRMALVNRIGEGDATAEWRPALDQFFTFVREFDAHSVTFEERVALLRAFRELDPGWRDAMDRAIAALIAERHRRRREAARVIGGLLADALTFALAAPVAPGASLDVERGPLERRFHDELRAREERARREVEALYGHRVASWQAVAMQGTALEGDLFALEVWEILGLTPGQLVGAGAVSGAVVGGGIDAAVGGASIFTGTVLGGVLGGGAALWSVGRRFARASGGGLVSTLRDARRYLEGGRMVRIGPHRGPAFPWVLLDRALVHYRSVATLAHARRGTVTLPAAQGEGIVAQLGTVERARLERLFQRVRRRSGDARDELVERVGKLLEGLDPV